MESQIDTKPKETIEKEESKTDKPQEFKSMFQDLENDDTPADKVVSVCMECGENGETKFMFTKIPMFKEVIISSFVCEECGYKNSEVQFGGKIADFGIRYTLNVINEENMNRQVVKSEFASVKIPALDLEIPAQTQKGSINTIEGFILKTIEGIEDLQEERRKYDPITAKKIDDFIALLKEYREGKKYPFEFILEDPSGNSFIQNPWAPSTDSYCKKEEYQRSIEHYTFMGFNQQQAEIEYQNELARFEKKTQEASTKKGQSKEEQETMLKKAQAYAVQNQNEVVIANMKDFGLKTGEDEITGIKDDPNKQIMTFPTGCYACNAEGETRMCTCSIPFFKEIIIMAFTCDKCGYRTSDVKNGGGISEKGTKITFSVTEEADINRDIFKSDTCCFEIPELDFSMDIGTLGSMYTTVEGFIQKVRDELEKNNPFSHGDSATDKKFMEFLNKLDEYKTGKHPFTIILEDPLSNCFIYNPKAPEEDPKIKIEIFERTKEQNDELGISDMNV